MEDIVGSIKESTSYGSYRVLSYNGKINGKHMYTVVFLNSGFKKDVNREQARKGSIVDDMVKELKAKSKKKSVFKKKKKMEDKEEIIRINKKMSDTFILGLDQSTTCTGYCVYKGKELIKYGIHTPEKTDPLHKRINNTKRFINKLIKEYNIDAVVIESVYLGDNVQVLFALSCLFGVVKDISIDNNIPCVSISAPTWKSSADILHGDRDNQKQLGVSIIKNTFGITVPHDISDAIILTAVGIKERMIFLKDIAY